MKVGDKILYKGEKAEVIDIGRYGITARIAIDDRIITVDISDITIIQQEGTTNE